MRKAVNKSIKILITLLFIGAVAMFTSVAMADSVYAEEMSA